MSCTGRSCYGCSSTARSIVSMGGCVVHVVLRRRSSGRGGGSLARPPEPWRLAAGDDMVGGVWHAAIVLLHVGMALGLPHAASKVQWPSEACYGLGCECVQFHSFSGWSFALRKG